MEHIQISPIEESEWIEHYSDLWYDVNQIEVRIPEMDTRYLDDISLEELTEALHATKNRKAIGRDGVNSELLKYDGMCLHLRLLHIYTMCWKCGKYQRTDGELSCYHYFTNVRENYREISLLETAYKIYGKILND